MKLDMKLDMNLDMNLAPRPSSERLVGARAIFWRSWLREAPRLRALGKAPQRSERLGWLLQASGAPAVHDERWSRWS